MKKYFVECAPPTPNGKLHLGHIAGPYIAADLFNRTQRVNSNETFFACDVDSNQSYVRLAALMEKIDREIFLEEKINSIRDTFAQYDIGFDLFNLISTKNRTDFIVSFINPLFNSKYVFEKEIEFYFDESTDKCLVEAFISGTCTQCFKPVKGGVCEICGYYNFSTDITDPFPTVNQNTVSKKRNYKIHVLRTEPLLAELINTLNNIDIESGIREFISEILSKIPHEFPITLPLEDGIDLGFQKVKLNPWVELLGSTYYLKHAAKNTLNCSSYKDLFHKCFIGIDNTFYYIIVHNLLRICLKLEDFPESYVVNRFYLLNNSKFSTSRKNAVWADEIAQQFDANILRLFLAMTHPSKEPYNFSIEKLMDFNKALHANDWVNKLKIPLTRNLSNVEKLETISPNLNAQSLLATINDSNIDNNIKCLIQVICPSLFKKLLRKVRKIPHIVKETSNAFKREFGVELNRLIGLDENKFGSSIVNIKPGKHTTPHSHNELDELFYIIQGQGLLTLDGQESVVSEGDYVYIPGGMMHTLKHIGDIELKFITIAWYI